MSISTLKQRVRPVPGPATGPGNASKATSRGSEAKSASRMLTVITVALALVASGAYWYWFRPAHRFELGLAALRERDLERVQYELQFLDSRPDYGPHVSLLEGATLLLANEPGAAYRALTYSVEHPDTRMYGALLLGECHYKLGRFRAAESAWLGVLNQHPYQTDAYRWLAAAYYDQGMMAKAVTALQRLAQIDQTDPRANRLLGLIHADFGQHGTAVESYRESLRRSTQQPDADVVRTELAQSLHNLREDAEAIEVLADCQPNADTLAIEAECLYSLGRDKQATLMADQALKLDPKHLDALLTRGNMYLVARDYPRAVRVLERAVRVRSKDYRAHFKLAQAYEKQGNRKKAAREHATTKDLHELHKRFQQLHDRLVEASPDVALTKDDAQVRLELGKLAAQLDLPEVAMGWFRAALSLDPELIEARVAMQGLADTVAPDAPPAEFSRRTPERVPDKLREPPDR